MIVGEEGIGVTESSRENDVINPIEDRAIR